MTRPERHDAPWWTVPPPRQVSHLAGVDPDLLEAASDPLPPDAPAVVRFRPAPGDGHAALVDALDRVALALFPHWLPGGDTLDDGSLLARPAVRALAAGAAARTPHFGPFLADLATRAWQARTGATPDRPAALPLEVRAAGLVRVLRTAYDRPALAVLVDLPPTGQGALVTHCEWLAHHGRTAVWLAGDPDRAGDRVPAVRLTIPGRLVTLPDGRTPPPLSFPPLSGRPRADSAAETRLERALRPHAWATGRHWNHVYAFDPLAAPYRLDLFWPVAGLVVEVDGDEHRERLRYAADRHRDVQLQLLGHDVLRFTNDQVLHDVDAVVRRIQAALVRRRATTTPPIEMRDHARR